jgi:hypothetical protein
MDTGDWAAAEAHLGRDLALVERTAPEKTRLVGQLLSQLGTCALERGRPAEARERFLQSGAIAATGGDPIGQAFAELGLGRVALREGALDEAGSHAEQAGAALARAAAPAGFLDEMQVRTAQLEAELALVRGDGERAVARFRDVCAGIARNAGFSPVERAWVETIP